MVDPSRLSQKALPTQTYIEAVIVDRKELQATENLRLSPHPRDLQINYTSPTFLIPQRVKFRYQLDGYERDWHDAGSRRQAFYTDLPPGKYSFRVIACNSEGIWNDSAAKLDFFVARAYYQTSWFRALCVLALLALLWALYQLRLRQLARQFNMRLEERVGERTRIARDLHDTLLQSISAKQWQTINVHMETNRQDLTAKKLRLNESTVSRNLRRGFWWQIQETREAMERVIEAYLP
jgi:hypothetical protein